MLRDAVYHYQTLATCLFHEVLTTNGQLRFLAGIPGPDTSMHQISRPITLETTRCLLLELRRSDASFWYQFMDNSSVNRYLPDRFESQQEAEEIINWLISNYEKTPKEAIRITLSVSLKEKPEMPVGWVSTGPLPEDASLREIGFALGPEQWGKGLATEATRCFAQWVQEMYPKTDLYATVDVRNLASIRVLTKIGMSRYAASGGRSVSPAKDHEIYWFRRQRQDA